MGGIMDHMSTHELMICYSSVMSICESSHIY